MSTGAIARSKTFVSSQNPTFLNGPYIRITHNVYYVTSYVGQAQARPWSKFLVDNCGEDVWTEDDVFRIQPLYVPHRDQFEEALKQIYNARGKLTHGGHAFPSSAAFGIHPHVPARIMLELHPTKPGFPPLVWFERVVNSALRGFAKRSLAADAKLPVTPDRPASARTDHCCHFTAEALYGGIPRPLVVGQTEHRGTRNSFNFNHLIQFCGWCHQ